MNIEQVVILGVGSSASLFFASCSVWLWRRAALASADTRQANTPLTPAEHGARAAPVPTPASTPAPATAPVSTPAAAAPPRAPPGPQEHPAPAPTAESPQGMGWAQPGQSRQVNSAQREAFEKAALAQLLQKDAEGDLDGATTNFFLKKPAKKPTKKPADERAKTMHFMRGPAQSAKRPRKQFDFGDGPLEHEYETDAPETDAPAARDDQEQTAPTKRAGPPRGALPPPPPPASSRPRRSVLPPPPPPPRRG